MITPEHYNSILNDFNRQFDLLSSHLPNITDVELTKVMACGALMKAEAVDAWYSTKNKELWDEIKSLRKEIEKLKKHTDYKEEKKD